MSELKPWLESGDAPSEVLALIRSARPSSPISPHVRERSRRHVAKLVALPAAAGAFMWLQHVAYGALLGVAVTGSVVVAPRVWPALAPADERPPSAAIVPRGLAKPTTVRIATKDVVPPSAAVSGAPARRPTAAFRVENGEHELSREARSLERARSLVFSDPAGALTALRRHRLEFPHGTLDIECSFLEVEALVRAGRRSEAEALAQALRARAPGSLYEGRLDRLITGGR